MDRTRSDFGTLYVISAPSGGGKTTLVNKLLEHSPYVTRAVTHTTRAPREGEIHGEHYHFVSIEEFKALLAEDGFLEHAEVFGNWYGTSKGEIVKQTQEGKDVVLVIDWQGAEQVKKLMPEAVLIFILPPSIDALRARLDHRNLDSQAIGDKRMEDAKNQIKHYKNFDYLIVNEDLDVAFLELRSIFHSNRLRRKYQEVALADLLEKLLPN